MPIVRIRQKLATHDVAVLDAYVKDARKAVKVVYGSEVLNPQTVGAEMSALAETSRSTTPIWHLVISWPKGDAVTVDEAIGATRKFLDKFGFTSHQYVIAAHGDAGHRHCHILLNRVDLVTRATTDPRLSRARLEAFREDLEVAHGWTVTTKATAAAISQGARDAETWNGEMSFERFVRARIEAAAPASWVELDAAVEIVGVRRETVRTAKGTVRGHVFVHTYEGKTYRVRASRVGVTPARTAGWVDAPQLQLHHVAPAQASYGALLRTAELPSPDLRPDQLARRSEWEARRPQLGANDRAQFGYWLRREAGHQSDVEAPSVTSRHNGATMQDDHNSVREGAASGATTSGGHAAEQERNGFRPGAALEDVPLTDSLFADQCAQYANYKQNRLSQDQLIGDALKSRGHEATLADGAITRNSKELEAAPAAPARLFAARNLVDALTMRALVQERTVFDLAPLHSHLRDLGVLSFEGFLNDRVQDEEQRRSILEFARTKEHDFGEERIKPSFSYDDGLRAVAHLQVKVDGDGLAYFDSRETPLFTEHDRALWLADRPSDQSVDASLKMAAMRWKTVEITGTDAFKQMALERAVALNIKVTNQELQERYIQLLAAQPQPSMEGIVLPSWARPERHAAELDHVEEEQIYSREDIQDRLLATIDEILPQSLFARDAASLAYEEGETLDGTVLYAAKTMFASDAPPVEVAVVRDAHGRVVATPNPQSVLEGKTIAMEVRRIVEDLELVAVDPARQDESLETEREMLEPLFDDERTADLSASGLGR